MSSRAVTPNGTAEGRSAPSGGAQNETTSGAGQAGAAGDATGSDTNLGAPCTSDASCVGGVATLCFKNPNAPAGTPGICTIFHCDSAACGDVLNCCDCSTSSLLKDMYVEPRCFPPDGVTAMKAYGCTCT